MATPRPASPTPDRPTPDRPLPAGVYRRRRLLVLLAAVAVVAVIVGVGVSLAATPHEPDAGGAPAGSPTASAAGSASPSAPPATEPAPPADPSTPTPDPEPTFDRAAQSIDDPDSEWVVVDKLRPLNPRDYTPELVAANVPHVYDPLLRPAAAAALEQMFATYTAETGLQMQAQSAYRSFGTQTNVYNGYVASNGQAWADRGSARPGYSEHQTGLSLDISALPANCTLQECFADTPQGRWLADNAYRFGFTLRYLRDKEPVTGYKFEPWHYRYVGLELAAELHAEGTPTLEEFFGLPAAPAYAP